MTAEHPPMSAKRNTGASIRALLLNIARKQRRDYNALLIEFAQERFLYRLSISSFSSHFVLKGALLLRAYPLPFARPTKDIDFLGQRISNEIPEITEIMRAIQMIPCDDGIVFLPERTTVVRITEQAEYVGARAGVHANLAGARVRIQIDIGFGDVITPGPVEMDYPVLLKFPFPRLHVYSLESSIAEKLQSLAKLGALTSRMKDIYDILFIAGQKSFQQDALHSAIIATFSTRGTSLDSIAGILGETFSADRPKQKQWSAFLKLQGTGLQPDFSKAIMQLREFIEPAINPIKPNAAWNPATWRWA